MNLFSDNELQKRFVQKIGEHSYRMKCPVDIYKGVDICHGCPSKYDCMIATLKKLHKYEESIPFDRIEEAAELLRQKDGLSKRGEQNSGM